MRSRLRVISSLILISFLMEQASFAAELQPVRFDLFERPKVELRLPASVASIEDAWLAPKVSSPNVLIGDPGLDSRFRGNDMMVYLLQDAHTNESGQINLAKTLDILLKENKDLKYIFVEAGVGDDSLSFLRKSSTLQKRKQVATEYLKKGILHGEEYLDLTSDHNFTIWGVEDIQLYQKAIDAYRAVVKDREKFQAYLSKIQTTITTLKPRIFNPGLLSFDEKYSKFLKEPSFAEASEGRETSLTDYFQTLTQEAQKRNVSLLGYPYLLALDQLKDKESQIDFKKAGEEQQKAIQSLSPEDQKELLEYAKKEFPFKLGSQDRKEDKAFYVLLEERLAALDPSVPPQAGHLPFARGGNGSYPELSKYFAYLKEAKTLNPSKILEEQKQLEDELFSVLAKSQDERILLRCQKSLRALQKLFDLKLTPEEYSEYKEDSKDFTIKHLTGFLNKKIMDLQNLYERATFLEEGYDAIVKNSETFYELTKDRDEKFVENMLSKLDLPPSPSFIKEGERQGAVKAVLITGGFHTTNLKALFKEKNISFVSITPQVYQETNQKRYESILLNQKISSTPVFNQAPMKHMARIAEMGSNPVYGPMILQALGQSGARLAERPAHFLRGPSVHQKQPSYFKNTGARLAGFSDVNLVVTAPGYEERSAVFLSKNGSVGAAPVAPVVFSGFGDGEQNVVFRDPAAIAGKDVLLHFPLRAKSGFISGKDFVQLLLTIGGLRDFHAKNIRLVLPESVEARPAVLRLLSGLTDGQVYLADEKYFEPGSEIRAGSSGFRRYESDSQHWVPATDTDPSGVIFTSEFDDLKRRVAERLSIPSFSVSDSSKIPAELSEAKHAVVIHSTKTDQGILDLVYLLDALKESGVGKISLMVPYFGYARAHWNYAQPKFGSAAVSANAAKVLLEAINQYTDRLGTVNIHFFKEYGLQYFEDVPGVTINNLDAFPLIARQLKNRADAIGEKKSILIGPDGGSLWFVKRAAEEIGWPYGYIVKKRLDGQTVERQSDQVVNEKGEPVDVTGMSAHILDDIIANGTTVVSAGQILRVRGAVSVDASAVHGVFAKGTHLEGINRVSAADTIQTTLAPEHKIHLDELIANFVRETSMGARLSSGARPEDYPAPDLANPPSYTAGAVLKNSILNKESNRWADPELSALPEADRGMWTEKIRERTLRVAPWFKNFGSDGLPKNPKKTGIKGRGLWGWFGLNVTEDPMVFRYNSEGKLELLIIHRKHGGGWALPGGISKRGEETLKGITATRELFEETGADMDMTRGVLVYEDFNNDWRDTDEAFGYGRAYAVLLSYEESLDLKLKAGDDADEVKWQEVSSEMGLFARHDQMVRSAVQKIESGQLTTESSKNAMRQYPPLTLSARQLDKTYQSFREGKHRVTQSYDLVAERAPHGGELIVVAGIERALSDLRRRRFTPDHLEALRKKERYSEEFLEYLKNFTYEGDIDSAEEGEIISMGIPIMRLVASETELALIEDLLANRIGFSSNIATKAMRIVEAAGPRAVVDYGQRRVQAEASSTASEAAIVGGAVATSNVKAAKQHYLDVSGTVAHFWQMLFGPKREAEAFRRLAAHTKNPTFLLDTYDTIKGAKNAITVALEMRARGEELFAVRLDSGDLEKLSKKVRKMLDRAGLQSVKIIASDDLDEFKIQKLVEAGAPIDYFGVGTNLVTGGKDAVLPLKFVRSNENRYWKVIHQKKVTKYAVTDAGEVARAGYSEEVREIMSPVWRAGQRVRGVEKPWKAHERAVSERAHLTPGQKKLSGAETIPVEDRKNPLSFNQKTDGVLVIDDQGAFKYRGGLAVGGGEVISKLGRWILDLVPKWNKFASIDRHSRGSISWASSFVDIPPMTFLTYDTVKDWTPENNGITPHALFTLAELKEHLRKAGGQMLWPDHAGDGTAESTLDPSMLDKEFQYVVIKGMKSVTDSYSAFFDNEGNPTELAQKIREQGIKRLFIYGLAWDYCVRFSAEDARKLGFAVVVIRDATRPVGFPENAIKDTEDSFQSLGVQIAMTKDFIDANQNMGVWPAQQLAEPIAHPHMPAEDESTALEEDFYHLAMGYSLYKEKLHDKPITMDYYYRKPLYGRKSMVVSGGKFIREKLRNFRFTESDIAYLRSLNRFEDEAFFEFLKNFRFNADIDGLPDGSTAFPNEPILRVRGAAFEVLIVETLILKYMNYNTLIASEAATIKDGDPSRRLVLDAIAGAQGAAHRQAAYSAFLGGVDATTDLDAHFTEGVPIAWEGDEGDVLGPNFITGGASAAHGGVYKVGSFDGKDRLKVSSKLKTSRPGNKVILTVLDGAGKLINRLTGLDQDDNQIRLRKGWTTKVVSQPIMRAGDVVSNERSNWDARAYAKAEREYYAKIESSEMTPALGRRRRELIAEAKRETRAGARLAGLDELTAAANRDLQNSAAKERAVGEGSNAPTPEFSVVVESLKEKLLHDPTILSTVESDVVLKSLYIQTLNHLRHVSFEFEIEKNSKDYPHDFVLKGPYPYHPTIKAVEKTLEFFEIFSAQPGQVSSFQVVSENDRTARMDQLKAQQAEYVKRLTKDPLAVYQELIERLKKEGSTTSFRDEFGPIVEYLQLELSKPEVQELSRNNPPMNKFRELTFARLRKITKSEFPYQATLDEIERAVEFFDIVVRAKNPNKYPKLYHTDRYEYYWHQLAGEVSDQVILPTIASLGVTEFLLVRGVPIGLMGLTTTAERVDGYIQTPYEFFMHDVNHFRRMYQFMKEWIKKKGLNAHSFYEQSTRFIKNAIIPLLPSKKDDLNTKHIKQMVKMLLFEIDHEDALPADPEVIRDAMLRPPGHRTPFEKISGNKVTYVMEPGATTLAYVFRKVAHDFYDTPEYRKDFIVHQDARTRANIVAAAEMLLEALQQNNASIRGISTDTLMALVSTDRGFPADFWRTVVEDVRNRPGIAPPLNDDEVTSKELAVLDQQELQSQITRSQPHKLAFMKEPIFGYQIRSGLLADLPEVVQWELLKTYKQSSIAEKWLLGNIGSVIALQIASGELDFYVVSKNAHDNDYQKISAAEAGEKNPNLLDGLKHQEEEIGKLFASKDPNIVGALKTVPVEMIRMSDAGFRVDQEVTIGVPWGKQTKPAGKDAFLKWDGNEYHMIMTDLAGNPVSYVPVQGARLSQAGEKRTAFQSIVSDLLHRETVKNLRLAQAQINTTVGDFKGNADKIVEQASKAMDQDADIVVFPELTISGYLPQDLLFKNHFVRENKEKLFEVARRLGQLYQQKGKEIAAVVGFVDYDDEESLTKEVPDRKIYNALAFIVNGEIKGIYRKKDLPNYGVFDEKRYFNSQDEEKLVVDYKGIPIGINICEDIWNKLGPYETNAAWGAALQIAINASPFHLDKWPVRDGLLQERGRQTRSYFVYTNLVGGQDGIVFDGTSFITDPNGNVIQRASSFDEDLAVTDLQIPVKRSHRARFEFFNLKHRSSKDNLVRIRSAESKTKVNNPTHELTPHMERMEALYQTLVLGTRDYMQKNRFTNAFIGESGGIDSAVVTVIAAEALGKDNVTAISMPTEFNLNETKTDAHRVAESVGVHFYEKPIQEQLESMQAGAQKDSPEFSIFDVADENLQARIRGNYLMYHSNKVPRSVVLTTGNKSETAVGYATLYGDMAGGFGVIQDVYKTDIFALARYINQREGHEVIPWSIIDRPPSAELREGQKDTDSLPPYEVLDPILRAYVEQDKSARQIADEQKIDFAIVKKVLRMVDIAEYKRQQAAPGVKVTPNSFVANNRRMPITNAYVEGASGARLATFSADRLTLEKSAGFANFSDRLRDLGEGARLSTVAVLEPPVNIQPAKADWTKLETTVNSAHADVGLETDVQSIIQQNPQAFDAFLLKTRPLARQAQWRDGAAHFMTGSALIGIRETTVSGTTKLEAFVLIGGQNVLVRTVEDVNTATQELQARPQDQKTLEEQGAQSALRIAAKILDRVLPADTNYAQSQSEVKIDFGKLAESLEKVSTEERKTILLLLLHAIRMQNGNFYFANLDRLEADVQAEARKLIAQRPEDEGRIGTSRTDGFVLTEFEFFNGKANTTVDPVRNETVLYSSGFDSGNLPNVVAGARLALEAAKFYSENRVDGKIPVSGEGYARLRESFRTSRFFRALSTFSQGDFSADQANDVMLGIVRSLEAIQLVALKSLMQFLDNRLVAARLALQAELSA